MRKSKGNRKFKKHNNTIMLMGKKHTVRFFADKSIRFRRVLLLRFLFFGVFITSVLFLSAQSLSYIDLINLQKSNLDKVRGFFSYKGWTWHLSVQDKHDAYNYDDFNLVYDITTWKNYSEEFRYLSKEGNENIIIYITDSDNMFSIESESKRQFKHIATNTENDMLVSKYSRGDIQILFYTIRVKQYFSYNTVYEIRVVNTADLWNRVKKFCRNHFG